MPLAKPIRPVLAVLAPLLTLALPGNRLRGGAGDRAAGWPILGLGLVRAGIALVGTRRHA